MRIGLVVGDKTVFICTEGQPRPHDTMIIPADTLEKGRQGVTKIVVSHLPATWRVDDDGVLVPCYEAREE